jgi:menaquinone-specific isochorismate synthase
MTQGQQGNQGARLASLPQFQNSIEQQITSGLAHAEGPINSLEPIPISFTTPCEAINLLRWLTRIQVGPRVYWRHRDGDTEIAGIGAAVAVTSHEPAATGDCLDRIGRILASTQSDPFLRFFGATRFDRTGTPDQHWAHFPCFWFILPKLLITRSGKDYFLTVTSAWDGRSDLESLRTRLLESYDLFWRAGKPHDSDLPRVIARSDTPDQRRWTSGVDCALSAIAEGGVEKVVLARRSDLRLSGQTDPCQFLESLLVSGQNCYGFLIEPQRSLAFVGMSPERLFKLTDRHLVTEAVAGTVSAGRSESEAELFAKQLRHSDKDRREHCYVIDGLRASLAELCGTAISAEGTQVIRLARVQHLIRRLEGSLLPGKTLKDILNCIHPTAAVCGTPRDSARHLSREIEGFDRGWYASGVGIISHHESELVVGIRSALIDGDRMAVFAGAGIVNGSHPEAEWRELEQKISPILGALSGVGE